MGEAENLVFQLKFFPFELPDSRNVGEGAVLFFGKPSIKFGVAFA